MGMSENRKMLLALAAKNGGTLKMEMAQNLYSSDGAAKSAVQSLQLKGYLSFQAPGLFRLEKVPYEVREEYDLEPEPE